MYASLRHYYTGKQRAEPVLLNLSWNEIRQRAKVEESAQSVLDARQSHLDNGATLADLYDPL